MSVKLALDKFKLAVEEIKTFKEENPSKIIKIIMHEAPDPDAIGSAVGLQLRLKEFGVDSDIYYSGDISHPQNKTMVNMLNISINKINGQGLPDGLCICVDCTENNSIAENPILIIDHHKSSSKAKYTIIDANYGSCCSLVWKLMKDSGHIHNTDNFSVYTSLLLGIRTDTNDLISDTLSLEDFNGYQELLQYSDKAKLQEIMNYPFPRYLYDKRLALHKEGNSMEANGVFVGGIGYITPDQRDVIAILADEYTRMESVSTAIIFAIVDKKSLHVSIRSNLVSMDVNQYCKELFGDFGGGKSYAGGAKIPLNFYENIDKDDADMYWKLTCRQMFRRVLKENCKIQED